MSNYRHENSSAEGIALAHTIYGEPTTKTMRPESAGPGTVRQAAPVFSNYKPPKRRERDNPDRALCSEEGCKAYPKTGKNYCEGHARIHGEVKTCAKEDCKAPPKSGQKFCRWHGPKVSDESGSAD